MTTAHILVDDDDPTVRTLLRRAACAGHAIRESSQIWSGMRLRLKFWTSPGAVCKRNGEERELTTSEFDLLEAFVNRPHRVLSRDDIAAHRSIDNLAARLRKKIERDADRLRDGNDR